MKQEDQGSGFQGGGMQRRIRKEAGMRGSKGRLRAAHELVLLLLMLLIGPALICAQGTNGTDAPATSATGFTGRTTQDMNARLSDLFGQSSAPVVAPLGVDYRMGPEDLLSISVFEAPDLTRDVRVSSDGQVSLPLIGQVRASGLTTRAFEAVLEELLRRTYMKDPHVSVFVKEMESHPVSVFGAVKKPGVFQVRTGKTLIEVLSLAEGLAEDAGDTVIVIRHEDRDTTAAANPSDPDTGSPSVGPASAGGQIRVQAAAAPAGNSRSVEIDLRDLLSSGDPRFNVPVYPGDVVKVKRAGIVYVVGEVGKPGGYLLKTNENVSILQAIALAGGLTHTSAPGRARIIRTEGTTGERRELPIHVNRILQGKEPDRILQSKDIVFIPNSAGKAALYRSTDGILGVVGSALIYRY